jgi:glycosyltransferase involved in cell wall biosynthesis
MGAAVLYVQKRAHRAGAQTCLARVLRHPDMQRWNPILLCGEDGWLAEEVERVGVLVVRGTFPSSRSLLARVWGNATFARRVAGRLSQALLRPAIVHGNDHLEGLLGLRLARALGARSAIFLRSPGMTRDDYFKYRCNHYDLVAAVGEELQTKAQAWDPRHKIELIHDGISADEFAPPQAKPARAPDRVLVIGSHLDWKGWADLTEALFRLEQTGALLPIQFDFTGLPPDAGENDLQLTRLASTRCHFLGRTDEFRSLMLGYDLVINPSRMESFGMAAIEVLAAGVPLLSSRTGVIGEVQERPEMLFPPGRPNALAASLQNLLSRWSEIDFGVARAQENIRRKFLVDHTVTRLATVYDRLLNKPAN